MSRPSFSSAVASILALLASGMACGEKQNEVAPADAGTDADVFVPVDVLAAARVLPPGAGTPYSPSASRWIRDLEPTLIHEDFGTVRVQTRGDTAIVSFDRVRNARDYRIYEKPAPSTAETTAEGQVIHRGAVYRCSGDRPLQEVGPELVRVTGDVRAYQRTEADVVLGHVYRAAGEGRIPVYALGRPDGRADEGTAARFHASRAKLYTTSPELRTQLLAQAYRDDGIAFFVPAPGTAGTRKVYSYRTEPQVQWQNRRFDLYIAEGPEKEARAKTETKLEPAFDVLDAPAPNTVPLMRVIYGFGDYHDELAAGEAEFELIRRQGNQPLTYLHWSGLPRDRKTTLVIDALDVGCPYQGHLGAQSIAPIPLTEPIRTIEDMQAQSPTGEAFINGQFDPANRPKVLSSFEIEVQAMEDPAMEFYETFSVPLEPLTLEYADDNNGQYHLVSPTWDVDWADVERPMHGLGIVRGELIVNFVDRIFGVPSRFRLAPRKMTELSPSNFLHATMDVTIAGTPRRYPQLWISDRPPPIHEQLAQGRGLLIQPIWRDERMELQVQFCRDRRWNADQQCPGIPINRVQTISRGDDSKPLVPSVVAGELQGFDLPVRLEAWVSTTTAYVFLEGRPYGCTHLPQGGFEPGPASVTWGAVLDHSSIDEAVVTETAPHKFLQRYGLRQTDRFFDNLGFQAGQPMPTWDHERLPCTDAPTWE